MRVLHLAPPLEAGSGLTQYARALEAVGQAAGIEYLRLDQPLRQDPPLNSVGDVRRYVRAARQAMRACDVVHAELGGGALREFYAALAAIRDRKPLVITVHDAPRPVWYPFLVAGIRDRNRITGLHLRASEPFARALENFVLKNAQKVCATTPAARIAIEQRMVRTDGVDVLAYPVHGIAPDIHTCGLESQSLKVAFHGHWMPGKGIEQLLNALAELRREGIIIRATIFGKASQSAGIVRSTRYQDEILSLIQEERLEPIVKVAGYINDDVLLSTLGGFHAVVLPYDRVPVGHRQFVASLSAAAHDAILAGVPVICSGARAMGDLIEDGVSGFIYSDRAGDSLTDLLRQLAQHPDRLLDARAGAAAAAMRLRCARGGEEIARIYAEAADAMPLTSGANETGIGNAPELSGPAH